MITKLNKPMESIKTPKNQNSILQVDEDKIGFGK